MRKLIISLSAVFAAVSFTHAQNQDDVLRFSRTAQLGTARSQGLGGAMGAVGADFSATGINPAGLGLYRRNEFNFSMAVTADQTSTSFQGNTETDSRTNFNIPTLGIVLTKVYGDLGRPREKGLVSFTFATGMNRLYNYQQNYYYTGNNSQNSLLDYFVQSANGTNVSNYQDANSNYLKNDPAYQAWQTVLLNTKAGSSDTYQSWLKPGDQFSLKQSNQVSTRGSAYEYNISGGANISNVIYLGAGLIFTNINSQYSSAYQESVLSHTPSDTIDYRGSRFTTDITSTGTGVSGRFGVIVRPVDFLRVGFSAQTPSRLYMHDEYRFTTTAFFAGQATQQYIPASKDYIDYQVLTPAHYTGSIALVSRVGLLSADLEMVDYGSAQIKSDAANFDAANANIRNNFQTAYNLRVGGEYKIESSDNTADGYRIRAGYARYGSPYKSSATSVSASDLTRQSFSLGFGMIFDRIFIDLTAVGMYGKNYSSPYTLNDGTQPVAATSYSNYNFVLSGGVRF